MHRENLLPVDIIIGPSSHSRVIGPSDPFSPTYKSFKLVLPRVVLCDELGTIVLNALLASFACL